MLLDQIIERLAHDRSKAAAESESERLRRALRDSDGDLPLSAGHIITGFMKQYRPTHQGPRMREAEVMGAMSAFIESIAPKISVAVEVQLSGTAGARADLLLNREQEKVLVELKGTRFSPMLVRAALQKLDRYMDVSGITQGVLVLANRPFDTTGLSDVQTPCGRRVVVVAPERVAT